jgi:hypothetical protein
MVRVMTDVRGRWAAIVVAVIPFACAGGVSAQTLAATAVPSAAATSFAGRSLNRQPLVAPLRIVTLAPNAAPALAAPVAEFAPPVADVVITASMSANVPATPVGGFAAPVSVGMCCPVAPVAEAQTYAMMLLGLAFVGFVKQYSGSKERLIK